MSPLSVQAILLGLIGAAGCAVPLAIGRNQKLPTWLMPLATGAMVGFCAFGIVPELLEEGGRLAALITAGVAVLYCILHSRHAFQHAHAGHDHGLGDHQHHPKPSANRHSQDCEDHCGLDHRSVTHLEKPMTLLFTSIFIHSMFDGGLLVISNTLLSHVSTVVVSLGIHKAFEALSLASIVISRTKSVKSASLWLAAYVASFPIGVLFALEIKDILPASQIERVSTVVMAIAIGNLISCLVFDFVMPTLSQVKHRRIEAAWLAMGVVGAAAILGGL